MSVVGDEPDDSAKTKSPRIRMRRERSVSESLLSIVLVLESLLVFFVTLTVYALSLLPALPTLVAGGALFVVILGVSRSLRSRWARWVAWTVQAILIASGVLLPLMFIIGTGFVALYSYCFVTGRRLDRRNARFTAAEEEASRTDPNPPDPNPPDPNPPVPNPKETP
ncbi:MAG: DUF4233 domain-containing protein [Microbacteriaceae bacterium]|nr:DUF4233 domain-containing protein [Microbacteriaceae bacterium]